jgi:hypothetical protein
MINFKIIAIVPLKECDSKFTKNLKIGEIYNFYQDYIIFLNNSKSRIQSVKNSEAHLNDLNLYSSRNDINVSISAVVGENGSGKSSLIELLYYMIYFIGTRSKKRGKENETIIETSEIRINYELQEIEEIIGEWSISSLREKIEILLSRIVNKYKIDISEKGLRKPLKKFISEKLDEHKNRIVRRIESASEIESNINRKLNAALIFETDQIYCAEVIEGKFSISTFKEGIKTKVEALVNFDLENFFYSISVNYSHHSLNSNSLGEWINALFHKNDGYQTPLVINPMRTNGNFNVNHENRLLKERLIGNVTFNLFKDPEYKLLGKYRFEKFIFSPKLSTGEETVGIKPFDYQPNYFTNDPIGQILYCKGVAILKNDEITSRSIAYLDKKVFRIPEQYPFLFKGKISRKNYKELVQFVNKDGTHITKKIYQTILFLQNYGRTKELKAFWQPNKFGQIKLTKNKMLKWLGSFKKHIINLTERGQELSPYHFSLFSLPGFMNVDFEITDTEKGKTFKLSELSSGEQQIILNLSSISYHLHNIQSIHSEDEKRIKYKFVNILLDEIELYYHPNSQRKMVSEILDSIKEVPLSKKGIQAVNVLFSTHSPFILSDIPSKNILRLMNGLPMHNTEQTFGSNINDLLADSFFMETIIGKFAEEKITKVIENIKTQKSDKSDETIISLIGDSFLKTGIEQFRKEIHDQNRDTTN